jgi:hypothetical protein
MTVAMVVLLRDFRLMVCIADREITAFYIRLTVVMSHTSSFEIFVTYCQTWEFNGFLTNKNGNLDI